MRQIVATDTFDASIGASWDNGWADWGTLAWVSGGHVKGTAGTETAMRYNTGTWARKQWARVTYNVITTTPSKAFGPLLLAVGGATDESCYTGMFSAHNVSGWRYGIAEWSSAFGETVHSLTGDGTTPAFVAGDTLTIESDGAGNLTLWACEANVNGGVERVVATFTDTTIVSGNPGVYFWMSPDNGDSATRWDAGNLLSSWPEVCPHRPHQYHRAHNMR